VVAVAAAKALASPQARGPEMALLRVVVGAVAVKLGFDFSQYVR